MDRKKRVILASIVVVALAAISIILSKGCPEESETSTPTENIKDSTELFGLDLSLYTKDTAMVKYGETLGGILARLGVAPSTTDKINNISDSIFPVRNIRAEKKYVVLNSKDTTSSKEMHILYQKNSVDYVVFSIYNPDSVAVRCNSKDILTNRVSRSGIINSSLWNAMIDGGMSPAVSVELSEIYAWSIDFFGLQKGDSFKVIYDEQMVDSTIVGTGMIWGAEFTHNDKVYYAIPYMQDGKVRYWDENGKSLRKNFLKAPLKYSRISSRFSTSRLHPIYKIRRPHLGVDYAAPAGTPVYSVADGVVTFRAYSGDGGNMVKVKHPKNMMTGYLHLKSYAKGIVVGAQVRQGDLIGYVGSTGAATGPHLDFRVWRGGKAIDPLKITAEPIAPINQEDMGRYRIVKDRVLGELNGNIAETMKISMRDITPNADSLNLYTQQSENR